LEGVSINNSGDEGVVINNSRGESVVSRGGGGITHQGVGQSTEEGAEVIESERRAEGKSRTSRWGAQVTERQQQVRDVDSVAPLDDSAVLRGPQSSH
jgi:hypothetical protein